MRARVWLPLYLPPLFFLLMFGPTPFVQSPEQVVPAAMMTLFLPAVLLLLAIFTHLHLYRIERQRTRMRRDFIRGK